MLNEIVAPAQNPWTLFGEGRWVKNTPTEPGRYLVWFGQNMIVDVYERDGGLVAYHDRFGHRGVEDLFSSRWRWSVALPDLPAVPR